PSVLRSRRASTYGPQSNGRLAESQGTDGCRDDQSRRQQADSSSVLTGSVTVARVPWPGALASVIVPPWASTSDFTTARPMPVPGMLAVPGARKYGSKTRGSASAAMPGPSSAIASSTRLPLPRALTVITVPAGAYLTALDRG